jgi:hypothetical protein
MNRCIRSLTRLFVAVTIAFGRTPAIKLLELLQRPSITMVAPSRRGRVEYTSLFTDDVEGAPALSQEGAHGAYTQPERQDGSTHSRRYIPVRTA